MMVLVVRYTESEIGISTVVAAHTEWVKQGFAKRKLLLAGSKRNALGSVLVVIDMPRTTLEAWIATDPLVIAGVAEYEMIAMDVAFAQPELAVFLGEEK